MKKHESGNGKRHLDSPPMGWNSYDCYGCAASEQVLLPNLERMAECLKPAGYQYFVVDNGWFAEYRLEEGQRYPKQKHADDTRIDEYGRYIPSACYFPNGLQPIIERTHQLGLRFGLHLMRGIPRKAVLHNTAVLGTPYRARDIANLDDTCPWCHYNYGIDMTKPGAQAYYQSVIEQFASWGVDFIKADDITGHPQEIEALVQAIEDSGRQMVLSLSPGGQTTKERMPVYSRADMLRTTRDIWDNREDLEQAFQAWEAYQEVRIPGLWLDMDMIPFGHLQLWNPRSNRNSVLDDGNEELSGKGFERMCGLTRDQQRTFITMRALAASPLFMGGDLPTTDAYSLDLITNRQMIECNQNGVMGSLIYRNDGIDVWNTPRKASLSVGGWIGIFNRSMLPRSIAIPLDQLGLAALPQNGRGLESVWPETEFNVQEHILCAELPADAVLFLNYRLD